ncbi:MAG: hypothetical protein ACK4SE_13915, partial [Brevundimonas sp.]
QLDSAQHEAGQLREQLAAEQQRAQGLQDSLQAAEQAREREAEVEAEAAALRERVAELEAVEEELRDKLQSSEEAAEAQRARAAEAEAEAAAAREGDLERRAVNGRIYQPIRGNGDFLSLAFRYQEDRNNTYGRKNVDQFNNGVIAGGNTNYCSLVSGGAGRQDQGNAAANPGCNSFYGYFINPTDSFNVRGQSRFTLTEKLTLTIDPQFSYTLANGGGTSLIEETDQRLQGTFFDATSAATRTARGVDLNGDG